ncbi:uncharacterized protein LOC113793411 [Dermatophagoides pteronyssinus]|uniref:Uncharacterized protein n=2 Tax=Dermatophagoides pteronyssinus TaxID=6956 RepID=A0ABQ8IUY0_DERPT|nr:retinal dehydrogenase 2-like [Dermatophagoides pteronyssinus]KAH9414084.1 hypothetical protein DERP_012563 [Dermatophagoides pteronyssinus]
MVSTIHLPDIKFTQLFIDGQFCNSSNGQTFESICPYTDSIIARLQQASKEDVDRTVMVARRAFNHWKSVPSPERGKYLYRLADLIEQNHQHLAALDSLENGIPIREMLHTSYASAEIFRFYAGIADKIKGETLPTACGDDLMTMTVRMPLGVCAIIIPWNSPTLMLAKTVAPSLAAGNTVIVKPAEQTSLSALFIAHLTTLIDGFPPGIFNVLTGDGHGVGSPLAEHMDIDKITFTGSTEVGQSIMAASARTNLKRVTLELGGKNPLVVFDDVPDIEKAARLATNAIFVSNGQVCCCGSRTYVQEKIYDQFVEACVRFARDRIVGNPLDINTEHGPQVDQQSIDKIIRMFQSGIDQGARLMIGGKPGTVKSLPTGHNSSVRYFIQPTVFADVNEQMQIGCEEIFGPVQCIMKFKTLDEIIERANQNKFGLGAGVLTPNINRALRFAREVRAGTCWVNCFFVVRPQTPFGGFRMSGFGREFGEEAMKEYMETKTISINLKMDNEYLFG